LELPGLLLLGAAVVPDLPVRISTLTLLPYFNLAVRISTLLLWHLRTR
jgi:hypothetical protein